MIKGTHTPKKMKIDLKEWKKKIRQFDSCDKISLL